MANESVPGVPHLGDTDDVEFALNGSLNLRRTVLRLLSRLRPELADWAMLAMPDHRTGGLALYGGTDVSFSTVIARSSVTERGLDQVLRSGQRMHRLVDTDVSAADIAAGLRHATLAEELAHMRPVDVLSLGLTARGTTLGAVALDSARIYEERGELAAVLKRTLRPPTLPRLTGFGIEVGGDFYDVVGDSDDLLLILGDVCEKGVDSAALTLQARQTVGTAAYFDRRPERVLEALNSVLCEQKVPR